MTELIICSTFINLIVNLWFMISQEHVPPIDLQVVERLINEEHAKSSFTEKSSSFSCSEAYTSLRNVGVFKSRQVSHCHYSNTDSSMLLTMHTEPSEVKFATLISSVSRI